MPAKWTDAYVLSKIRSMLRRMSMWMPAIREAKLRARRKYRGPRKLQQWEYQCAHCHGWFAEKDVHVDHTVPAGSLRSFDDLGPYCRRLLMCGADGLEILCKPHHQEKTNRERAERAKLKKRTR
jgi:hypothetical protein